ncbi:MAG: aldehyde dehydrogenase family protein [Solirubrobacterales bacterium]
MGTTTAPARPEAFVGGRREPFSDPEGSAEAAVAGAVSAQAEVKALSAADRAAILDRLAAALGERSAPLAAALAAEAGCLTRKDMELEVERAIDVITLCAAAAREGFDELINLEGSTRGRNAFSIVRRVPYGPMLAITAFNGPLLIAVHKVCPAIVAGVPVVLKPSPRVPRAALAFAELVVGAGWPAGALAVVPAGDELTMKLVVDQRLPVISFTGGPVGWKIKDAAPRKHVHLELGGPGAVLVAADGDLEEAAEQCVAGGFVRSGQACLSVQRIFAVDAVYDELVERLADRVGALSCESGTEGAADVGPLVDEAAADRVEGMIADAAERGARVVVGGRREGALVAPTLLADVDREMAVMRREVFGPVIAVCRVGSLAAALPEANSIGGMLQAAVFTADVDLALTMAGELDAGSVIVNGSNAWRIDSMPFGGTGMAGSGREGVRAMVYEITTTKNVVIRHRPKGL